MKKIISLILTSVLLLSLSGCSDYVSFETKKAEDAVCIVNIFVSTGSYNKRFLLADFGHSFISVENLTDKNITVGEYGLAKDEEVTLSIWPILGHNGVWYNIESEMIAESDKYSDRISVGFYIDRNTLETINDFVANAGSWSMFYNCSGFTLDIYNIITGASYRPLIATPKTVSRMILEYDHDVCKAIRSSGNIGYYKEGRFEKCELNYR